MDNHVKNKKYGNFVSISSLTGECAAEKFKKNCSSGLWTCSHHMVISGSQNKITGFWMILAWASPFNVQKCDCSRKDANLYHADGVGDY